MSYPIIAYTKICDFAGTECVLSLHLEDGRVLISSVISAYFKASFNGEGLIKAVKENGMDFDGYTIPTVIENLRPKYLKFLAEKGLEKVTEESRILSRSKKTTHSEFDELIKAAMKYNPNKKEG